jgi:hypothetical protein
MAKCCIAFGRISESKRENNFGWPYSYYDQMQKKNVLAPEYGGDGKMPAETVSVQLPIMEFSWSLGTK